MRFIHRLLSCASGQSGSCDLMSEVNTSIVLFFLSIAGLIAAVILCSLCFCSLLSLASSAWLLCRRRSAQPPLLHHRWLLFPNACAVCRSAVFGLEEGRQLGLTFCERIVHKACARDDSGACSVCGEAACRLEFTEAVPSPQPLISLSGPCLPGCRRPDFGEKTPLLPAGPLRLNRPACVRSELGAALCPFCGGGVELRSLQLHPFASFNVQAGECGHRWHKRCRASSGDVILGGELCPVCRFGQV